MHDKPRPGFQRAGHRADECFGFIMTKKSETISKTISAVIDITAFDSTHVTENEINRRDEVSTICVSRWIQRATLNRFGFSDKLLRDINPRDAQTKLR